MKRLLDYLKYLVAKYILKYVYERPWETKIRDVKYPIYAGRGDTIYFIHSGWSATYCTPEACSWETNTDVRDHLLAHPEKWEGDVFPIHALLTREVNQ